MEILIFYIPRNINVYIDYPCTFSALSHSLVALADFLVRLEKFPYPNCFDLCCR